MKRAGRLVLLALLMLMTGCGSAVNEKTELTLIHGWGTMEPDHIVMRDIYAGFEKQNPDIRLTQVSMPTSEEVVKKVENMLSVGKVPELVFAGGSGNDTFYRFMVENHMAVDFKPYMEADPEFARDVSPVVADYWSDPNGSLYTISDVLLMSGGYWYNREIFEAAGVANPPRTWDEFYDCCERIGKWAAAERNGVIPFEIDSDNAAYFADAYLYMTDPGNVWGSGNRKLKFSQESLQSLIANMKTLYQHSGTSSEGLNYRDSLGVFNAGGSAVYINGVWANTMISEDLDVGYAPLPAPDGKGISCISACLGFIAGNTLDASKTDAAIRFVKYMVSDEVQERILKETGQTPSNPAVDFDAYEADMPRFCQAVQAVRQAGVKTQVPENLWDSEDLQTFKVNISGVLNDEFNKQTFIDLLR